MTNEQPQYIFGSFLFYKKLAGVGLPPQKWNARKYQRILCHSEMFLKSHELESRIYEKLGEIGYKM